MLEIDGENYKRIDLDEEQALHSLSIIKRKLKTHLFAIFQFVSTTHRCNSQAPDPRTSQSGHEIARRDTRVKHEYDDYRDEIASLFEEYF